MYNLTLVVPKSPQGLIKVEMPTPGITYLYSYLSSKGLRVRIFDLNKQKILIDKIESEYVGIYLNETLLIQGLKIANLIKSRRPDIKTIAGGPYINTIKSLPENFNYGVVGDGEVPLFELLNGKDKHKIKGLIYRENGELVKNGRFINKNLDQLVFPDYSIYDLSKYEFLRKEKRFVPLITSRGCDYSCSFCSVKNSIGKWRMRSISNIIDEIKFHKKYDIKEFAFMDDNISHDLNHFKKLVESLVPLKISWQCPNGISTKGLNRALIKKMKKSGCWSLAIAPETGSFENRKKLGKNITNFEYKNVIKMCNDEGIFTISFFIIGFPWEAKTDIKRTEQYINDIDSDMPQIKTFVPFKASKFKSKGNVNKSFNDMKFSSPTKYISIKMLGKLYRSLYLRYYSPKRSMRIINKLLKNKAYYGVVYYIKNSIRFLFKAF